MRTFFWCLLGALLAVFVGWGPLFDGRPERWLFYIPFIFAWAALGVLTGVSRE